MFQMCLMATGQINKPNQFPADNSLEEIVFYVLNVASTEKVPKQASLVAAL